MKPILNLNKHPKDCENLSLINAENVKLSSDLSCLESEKNILESFSITNEINRYYEEDYKIINIIPCSKEILIFTHRLSDLTRLDIWRYNEFHDECKLVYYDLTYNNGEIKGAFTYNVNNELIVTFSEYNANKDVPLRTINFGKFDDNVDITNDQQEYKLSINPEVIIPSIVDYDYVPGLMYKGWYYIFIRYKINNNDYTQWFDIGGPILINNIEKQSIFKLYGYQYKNDIFKYFSTGILDHFSSESNITNESIKIKIDNIDNRYNKYQIGFLCVSKENIQSYISNDISNTIKDYEFNIDFMVNYDYQKLIYKINNYYDVKNIINYKNRLYISNYKEKYLSNFDTSNIKLYIREKYKQYNDVKNIIYSSTEETDENYLDIDKEIDYKNIIYSDSANAIIEKDLNIEGELFNTLIDSENDRINLEVASSSIIYTIKLGENGKYKDVVELLSNTAGRGIKIKDTFKIKSENNQTLNIEFYLEAYVNISNQYDNIYFKYINNNKTYYAKCIRRDIRISPDDTGFISFYISETNISSDILFENDETIKSLYINTKNSFNERKKITTLIPGEIYNFYIHFVDKYGAYTNGFKINPVETDLIKIIYNDKNEPLYKIQNNRPDSIPRENDYIFNFCNYEIYLEDVILPENYIGYFISYEKFESIKKVTGVLTKYDFNDKEYENNNSLNNYNKTSSNKMYFYASDFDIDDEIKLNYNKLIIERTNVFKSSEKEDVIQDSIVNNANNLNVIESGETVSTAMNQYSIENFDIKIANDASKNRFGLGTVLELPLIDDLFQEGTINIYKATLAYDRINIYNSEQKELIKCTNVIYPSLNNTLIQYLNGRNTYNGVIIFDNNKFIFNSANTQIYAENNKEYINYGNNEIDSNEQTAKPLVYIQFPTYKDYFYETKSFKNKPISINYRLDFGSSDEIYNPNIALGLLITPQNTIDLFENKYTNPNKLYPLVYQNNRIDITYLAQFDKFVRRSDIIQDESLSNAWRIFGTENYKIISENKGNITNLVGIGTYLLVHTEHSLFAFNADNTLNTIDKAIQLNTPDIFDVEYKELITSDLGYCGLQDSDAYVCDQFGYIFYDNDSNRIVRFDNNNLKYIDENILEFLLKYKPYKIRFAHHKNDNRILLSIDFNDKLTLNRNIVLSYNYKINQFISKHNYSFEKGIDSKSNLYLINKDSTNIFEFIKETNNIAYNHPCKLEIIINEKYNLIKQLEYIIYKLYKINYDNKDYISNPVEELRKPYSGDRIRVYNDEVDTGWLDIKINEEEYKNALNDYKKPYWDKGNWNFSYLRNKLSENLNYDIMSRLYGNYFIVSIIFGDSSEKVEFEVLNYVISKDNNI